MTTIATGNRRLLRLAAFLQTYRGPFSMAGCANCPCEIAKREKLFVTTPWADQTFALTNTEWWRLFNNSGNAHTAKQAAAYIRAFVKRRTPTKRARK